MECRALWKTWKTERNAETMKAQFIGICVAVAALWSPAARCDRPESNPFFTWEIGSYYGISARKLPTRSVPDGWAPHLELFGLEVRHYLSKGEQIGFLGLDMQPDRMEFQLNWLQGYLTYQGMTRPRLPAAAYATWIAAEDGVNRLTKSVGLYTELGRDRFVVDEKLRKRTAGTIALAGRVGVERTGRLGRGNKGLYLYSVAGFSLGRDPNQIGLSPHVRSGLEYCTTFGLMEQR
jgi:hypothetical protein